PTQDSASSGQAYLKTLHEFCLIARVSTSRMFEIMARPQGCEFRIGLREHGRVSLWQAPALRHLMQGLSSFMAALSDMPCKTSTPCLWITIASPVSSDVVKKIIAPSKSGSWYHPSYTAIYLAEINNNSSGQDGG